MEFRTKWLVRIYRQGCETNPLWNFPFEAFFENLLQLLKLVCFKKFEIKMPWFKARLKACWPLSWQSCQWEALCIRIVGSKIHSCFKDFHIIQQRDKMKFVNKNTCISRAHRIQTIDGNNNGDGKKTNSWLSVDG